MTLRTIMLIMMALAIATLSCVMIVSGDDSPASTKPITGEVTELTNGQVTFTATGIGSDGWFEWGSYSGQYYHWYTINQTYGGAPGAPSTFSDTVIGSTMLTGKTYYVRACDEYGCGQDVTWTVPTAQLPNRTSYGSGFIQILRSGFNMSYVLPAITAPYTETVPGGAPVTWGLLFFFVFAGYWLRPRDIFLPCVLAMIAGGAIWLGNTALGVPPEFASVGQGLMYASIAGIAVSWFSK